MMYLKNYNLKNKTAVVTGAGKGIGRACAIALAEAGANLIIISRTQKDLNEVSKKIKKLKSKCKAYVCDITNYNQIKNIINKIPKIDILINNAGIAGPNFKTWDYPLEEWQKVIDIDLSGVFYCCKTIVPHFIKNNYGRIVTISSIAGKEGNPNAMPYSAAKAGVIALTKSLGKELAENNISVNCVTPAPAKTRIFDQITQEHIDYMLSKIPRNRFVLVEELASLVAWMSSEENSYTTGSTFDLSGGRATY